MSSATRSQPPTRSSLPRPNTTIRCPACSRTPLTGRRGRPTSPSTASPSPSWASPSMLGTGRAQYHLRQSCVFLNMFPLNRPEVMIAQAQNKFDDQGCLTDETTRKFIGDLLVALADWTRRLDAKAEERQRLTTPLTDERPGSGRRRWWPFGK